MDYYELLDVTRNDSQETIKRAFHSRVLVTHPDVNHDNALAGQRTRQLIEAYRVLSDPRSRRCYDLFTTPVVSQSPITIPVSHVARGSSPVPAQRGGLLFVLLAAVFALVICYQVQSNRQPVFRPFLVNGELPSSVITRCFPVIVEPSLSEHVEWYHAQQYQLSLADPWITQRMIGVYRHAAQQAQVTGDTSRAQFYDSAIERANRLYL